MLWCGVDWYNGESAGPGLGNLLSGYSPSHNLVYLTGLLWEFQWREMQVYYSKLFREDWGKNVVVVVVKALNFLEAGHGTK